MLDNATPDYATLPPLHQRALAQEYVSRYGCWPSRDDPPWKQEPWCAAFLRVMDGALVLSHAEALDAAAVALVMIQEAP